MEPQSSAGSVACGDERGDCPPFGALVGARAPARWALRARGDPAAAEAGFQSQPSSWTGTRFRSARSTAIASTMIASMSPWGSLCRCASLSGSAVTRRRRRGGLVLPHQEELAAARRSRRAGAQTRGSCARRAGGTRRRAVLPAPAPARLARSRRPRPRARRHLQRARTRLRPVAVRAHAAVAVVDRRADMQLFVYPADGGR